MQSVLEYMVRFPESLYEHLICDSEEVSVQIFSLDKSHWDYTSPTGDVGNLNKRWRVFRRRCWQGDVNGMRPKFSIQWRLHNDLSDCMKAG